MSMAEVAEVAEVAERDGGDVRRAISPLRLLQRPCHWHSHSVMFVRNVADRWRICRRNNNISAILVKRARNDDKGQIMVWPVRCFSQECIVCQIVEV